MPSISRGEPEQVSNFYTNFAPPLQRDTPAPALEERNINGPKNRAVTEGLPVHSILDIEHYLEWMRFPGLALGCAKEHVEDLRSGASVWVGYKNAGMQALFGEIAVPDLELHFHSGPLTQSESISSSSRSRSGVKYLSRLPGGKASLPPLGTSFRPRISPFSTRQSTRSFGFSPTA